jgi:5-methylcytosine-specific restriction endonuclease McrA
MAAMFNGRDELIAKLTPGGDLGLAHLSDDELLANTRRLVGKSNQLLAALLAHLAEVEARGVHRTRRCASLYTYCIYELRFSEDAAARRSAAARLVKQFPVLFAAIANGELHLTGLLMIGPHLTFENHAAVLGRAKFRTKKELGKLVRDLNPLPQVADRMQPIGPAPMLAPRNPTWEQYVTSLAPPIRDLPLGERPSDWAKPLDVPHEVEAHEVEAGTVGASVTAAAGTAGGQSVADRQAERTMEDDGLPVGPVPRDLPPVTGPQHYQVQFSTIEEHAELVERAKALLARSRPGVTLGELHLEAMRLFVASLEKRKFAVNEPSSAKRVRDQENDKTSSGRGDGTKDEAPPRQRGDLQNETPPRQRGGESDTPPSQRGERDVALPRCSRYVPAAERREVYRRDQGRCTYVDARGEQCCETHYLELHHVRPFALGGPSTASNLTLRCSAHNALAAEVDFGLQLVTERRNSKHHESLARQAIVDAELS